MTSTEEEQAVANFREYLRIKTVQPNPDYDGAVVFLKQQASQLGLTCEVIECVAGKPIVVMTWPGNDPTLPSLLLNSHIDVVPVFEEHWKHPPFAAVKDDHGDIYARGTQDMKCVGIQYLEAIRRLKKQKRQFLRTIHISFVPDEENGGFDGMMKYVKSKHFQTLNLGFALDEGIASPTDTFSVFYGERAGVVVKVTCPGDPGHGSRFIQNNAAEKLRRILNAFLGYRDREEQKLEDNPELNPGDVTTVNLTGVEGGVQSNVVPAEFSARFDIRITPRLDMAELESMIAGWCSDAGPGVRYEFLLKSGTDALTSTSPQDAWWRAFVTGVERLGCKIEKGIFSAGTDSRFFRELGYPAIGFSPINNTPVLLHDHNEYLNEEVFLKGIQIYFQLIPELANVKPSRK